MQKLHRISNKKRYVICKKIKLYLILTGVLLIGIVVFFETQIIPFELKCVEKESESVAVKIINNAVINTLDNYSYTYNDIADIKYSVEGKINSIETKSASINRIKSVIINNIQKKLDNDKTYFFYVPVGSFTKLNEFSSLGPKLEISFRLTGTVKCDIKSTFESAGVNQTIHHIYLQISADIITISPEYSKPIKITSDYEIAQTVIVGNIPDIYAKFDK